MVSRKSRSSRLPLGVYGYAMILVFVPWTQASHIVETIAFSMIGANTVGFVLWVYLANKLKISQPQKQKSPVSGSKVVASKENDS